MFTGQPYVDPSLFQTGYAITVVLRQLRPSDTEFFPRETLRLYCSGNRVTTRGESMNVQGVWNVPSIFAFLVACVLLSTPEDASGQVGRSISPFRARSFLGTLPRATAPLPPAASPLPRATAPLPRGTAPLPPATSSLPSAVAPLPQATAPLPPDVAPLPPAASELPPATAPLPPAVEALPPATAQLPQATTPLPPAVGPSSFQPKEHRSFNPSRARGAARFFHF